MSFALPRQGVSISRRDVICHALVSPIGRGRSVKVDRNGALGPGGRDLSGVSWQSPWQGLRMFATQKLTTHFCENMQFCHGFKNDI